MHEEEAARVATASVMSPGSKALISRWRRAKVTNAPPQAPACMPLHTARYMNRSLSIDPAGKEAAVQPEPDEEHGGDSGQVRRTAAAAGARMERGRDVPAGHLAARAANAGALGHGAARGRPRAAREGAGAAAYSDHVAWWPPRMYALVSSGYPGLQWSCRASVSCFAALA